ncbi:MAG: hypothetical protein DLM60_22370 [Pseudonocardiales bacterium]|nr:MAG: hypothetical protein DLM60_22370 [Pseudonocardiales bacterium]
MPAHPPQQRGPHASPTRTRETARHAARLQDRVQITAAVHLLEAGVEVNVIRGWLGHADLTTTNRYAEINTRAKIEALRNTEPPGASARPRPHPVWRSDESLLNWLASL